MQIAYSIFIKISFFSWKIIAVLVASMTWSYWFMSAVSPEAFVETVNQLSSPVFSLVAMLDQLQFTHLIVVVAIHVGSLLLFWNRIRDRPIHRYILYNILLPEMSLDLFLYILA